MNQNIRNYDCLRCGWCCRICPCHLTIYLGHEQETRSCDHLRIENGSSCCGLIEKAENEIKRHMAKKLILSGMGCTHNLGPDLRYIRLVLEGFYSATVNPAFYSKTLSDRIVEKEISGEIERLQEFIGKLPHKKKHIENMIIKYQEYIKEQI